MNDIGYLDATAQAELVRSKQVSPLELVDAAISRIEKVNPHLNAVITPMYEIAREAAQGPLPEGPFTGVPFLLKDLGPMYAGVRYTAGTAMLKEMVAPIDSELTKRQKAAGLITVGKTNTPEFGLVPTTEPRLHGITRNPWDVTCTTGGSSGGSAAAVASGMVPIAHANDGGGSIRIPASCCGVFGLKPTRARVSQAPLFGDTLSGLTIDHAVSRTVRDSAALLDATAGPAPGDPYWAPPQERPYASEVGVPPGRLRIAFTYKTVYGDAIHDDCVAAVRDVAKLCEELGHDVEEAAPPLNGEEIRGWFTSMWQAGVAQSVEEVSRITGREPTEDDLEPLTWALYQEGKNVSAATYLTAVSKMHLLTRQMAAFHEQYDLWLTPTLGEPPLPLGSLDAPPDNPLAAFDRAAEWVPYTPLQNATGQPAMSVPLYWNADGLPIGTHFVARFGDEATLFRLAAQLEEARPWAGKRPPVSAV